MNPRRDFLKFTAAAAVVGGGVRLTPVTASAATSAVSSRAAGGASSGAADRAYWCQIAAKLAVPLLPALAERRLKATMPVESHPRSKDRPVYTHLEGLGRLLAGIAPWLELPDDGTAEGKERARFAALARRAIDAATDPASPDFLNFSRGRQPLVDAAFLAQSMLRAPTELWVRLESRVQRNVVAALVSSRPIPAGENNWKLFASEIEAFLHRVGEARDDVRLFEGLSKFQEWYVGDGMYGDGPEFHADYYNAYVIQPMLLETLDVVGDESAEWRAFRSKVRERLTRFAAIQERSIAPDGSFPIIGRSIAYRAGAFQGLALAALRRMLPKEVSPAQARVALTATIRRTMEAPGTFDANGWLRIGVAGHQPGLGETYISTGSLYLCSFVLLPLGLPATDPFWTEPPGKTTWEKVWSGENLPVDKAIKSSKRG